MLAGARPGVSGPEVKSVQMAKVAAFGLSLGVSQNLAISLCPDDYGAVWPSSSMARMVSWSSRENFSLQVRLLSDFSRFRYEPRASSPGGANLMAIPHQ